MKLMVMTYAYALSNESNTFNKRHLNANNTNNTRRGIQTLYGRGGKGRCGGRGSGRGGRVGRRRGSGNPNACRNDSWQFTSINGNTIKVHPSYHFEQYQWFNILKDVQN